jgi:formylglycine-generating enzyme required for sulfatase activity
MDSARKTGNLSKLKRSLILIAGLLGSYWALRLIVSEVQKSTLYAEGVAAAETHLWPEAFTQFRTLAQLDPAYRDVQNLIRAAARQLAQADLDRTGLRVEVESLRWLAAANDAATLADVLDHSMMTISAGEFLMGSDEGRSDEHPMRSVYVDAFKIDRFEVTNAQYQRFLQATGRPSPTYWSGNNYPAGEADYPVVGVSWDNADAYCTWAGKRLPTEAEWEKTCRGTDGRRYPWGDAWDPKRADVEAAAQQAWPMDWDQAWALLRAPLSDSTSRRLRPVGSYLDGASTYGVFDLVGNASEWVWDWYNWSDYQKMPAQNPRGLGPPWNHSLRGSPWLDPYGRTDWVQDMSRCAARNSSHETRDPRVGFRCARSDAP